MRKNINKFIKHPLISGSTIIFVGSFFTNFMNWFFNLFIGGRHLLSVADYGMYSSLISFLGLFGIFSSSLLTIFAKFTAAYSVKGKNSQNINLLFHNGFKIVFLIALAVLIVLILLTFPIAGFLKLGDFKLLFLIFFAIFLSILSSLPLGILQGELRFFLISFINVLSPFLKISIGFLFLFLGFKISGKYNISRCKDSYSYRSKKEFKTVVFKFFIKN